MVNHKRCLPLHRCRDQQYNGQFGVITLQEFIDIAQAAPRVVGIYPGGRRRRAKSHARLTVIHAVVHCLERKLPGGHQFCLSCGVRLTAVLT